MKNVLCFGDSITRGSAPITNLRYPRDIRYTGVLQSILGNDYLVIEEGLNGRTCLLERKNDAYRNAQCYVEACLGSHQPVDYMVLMLGTNDSLLQFNVSAETIGKGMHQLVEKIINYTNAHQGGNLKLILCCPPIIGDNWENSPCAADLIGSKEKTMELMNIYKDIAKEFNIIFFNTNDYVKTSFEDSVHFDEEGQKEFACQIAKVIQNN